MDWPSTIFWLRRILVRYYIGAIVIAMLIVDALNSIVRAITFPVALLLQDRTPNIVRSGTTWFLAGQIASNLVAAALFLAVAYSLARWLYGMTIAPARPMPLGRVRRLLS